MVKRGIFVVLFTVILVGCPVTVIVSLSVASITLEPGQSFTLSATSTDATDAPFSWAIENPDVASLDATVGLNVTVTALKPGIARVTVTGAHSGVSTTATISVATPVAEEGAPDAVRVSVAPVSSVIEIGSTVALTASSSDAADTDFTWALGNATVATLSADTGTSVEATALTAGVTTVTVTGSASGASATATLSVLSGNGGNFGNPLLSKGLEVTITEVIIPEDLKPEIHFIATSEKGEAVPLEELTTAQFIIAYLPNGTAEYASASYVSYFTRTEAPEDLPPAEQATYDGNGLNGLTVNDDGTFAYKCLTAVPGDYDPSATHAAGGQFRRTSLLDGTVYVANAILEFRPDGEPIVQTRDIVATTSCNDCHTRLSLHGNVRRDVRLCILCHNPGSIDANSGNTVDMPVMIHKIHMGEELPSVQAGDPYQIIGYRDSVHDYSSVVFPQDIRNCTTCHGQEEDKVAQPDAYLTKPSMAACGACHDRVWFGEPTATPEGYENHPLDFAQDDDHMCAVCHPAEGSGLAPIREAHLTVEESPLNPGLNLEITQINANPADGALAIDFLATYGDGAPVTDLSALASVGSIVAWPSWEYEQYYSESIAMDSPTLDATNAASGAYRYTFTNLLPLDPGLSFGIVMTGRIRFDLDGAQQTVGLADNSLMYFTLDGNEPVQRRPVVDENQCDKCHNDIRAHGEQRVGIGACVMCHLSTQTDESRRPAEMLPAETVNFKDMIHRIHRGHALESDYTVYGYGGTAHDFTHVGFPGRLEKCSICHGENAVDLPLAEEVLPTVYEGQTILPQRAACTSCHDSLMANIHATLASDADSGIESCVVCHGADADYAVAVVHALEP